LLLVPTILAAIVMHPGTRWRRSSSWRRSRARAGRWASTRATATSRRRRRRDQGSGSGPAAVGGWRSGRRRGRGARWPVHQPGVPAGVPHCEDRGPGVLVVPGVLRRVRGGHVRVLSPPGPRRRGQPTPGLRRGV